MAYQGYLVKVGSYTIPMSIIKAESYKTTLNSQDLDSERDADGVLHRNALSHQPNKIEFETVPLLTNIQMSAIMANIRSQFTNTKEKKASVTLYVPEKDSYTTEDMYMADITFDIYYAGKDIIKYNPVRFAFIGY